MIRFDHLAITVDNLEVSIKFYELIGYKLINIFEDREYRWANLRLGSIGLEIFQMRDNDSLKIEHMAYSFDERHELLDLLRKMNKEMPESFYGDLNRETIFIEDIDGKEIQFIKKEE